MHLNPQRQVGKLSFLRHDGFSCVELETRLSAQCAPIMRRANEGGKARAVGTHGCTVPLFLFLAWAPSCRLTMTPTHTPRRGRLYRHYVCLGASRRGHDTCPVRSIAAAEVEALVLGQVRRLLAAPEVVARTTTAARREYGAAEDPLVDESEVIEALGALEPVWDELYPAEQARIMRLLIKRIDVAPDGISVTLHAAGIRSLVAELADQEAPTLAASEPLLEAAE
jgi:site-specific DNA recombinase